MKGKVEKKILAWSSCTHICSSVRPAKCHFHCRTYIAAFFATHIRIYQRIADSFSLINALYAKSKNLLEQQQKMLFTISQNTSDAFNASFILPIVYN